jgi:plasmid rolling circle replication initiator protein Rep
MKPITEQLLKELKFKKIKADEYDIERSAPDGIDSGYDWQRYNSTDKLFEVDYVSNFNWDIKDDKWNINFYIGGTFIDEIKDGDKLTQIVNGFETLKTLIKGKK